MRLFGRLICLSFSLALFRTGLGKPEKRGTDSFDADGVGDSTRNDSSEVFRRKIQDMKSLKKVELVILVDGSYSVGPENFMSEMKFIQKVISDVTVGSEAFRLGIVVYSSEAVIHVDHLSVTDPSDLEKCSLLHFDILKIAYPGLNTNTKDALEKAERILTRARRGALKIVFLLTDGFSNMGNPLPAADILREQGVEIFTFGIHSGNVKELESMATRPLDEHVYLFDSFEKFEGFARRALHEDLTPGNYLPAKNASFCSHLCSDPGENGCCSMEATCTCGSISGHFACLCPPGYYGNGLVGEGCTLCPEGTYSEGLFPGDALTCIPCPDDHHIIDAYPATSKASCVCESGTEADGDGCKVVSCPPLSPPSNGYFVKKSCSTAVNAACGVRCHLGFVLEGSSVRICQRNGTWSGTDPLCQAKTCDAPKLASNSMVTCSNEDYATDAGVLYERRGGNEILVKTPKVHDEENGDSDVLANQTTLSKYPVGIRCNYSCSPGYFLVGSKTRNCLPMLKWSGLKATCKSIKCSSLPKLTNGSIKPKNCTEAGLKHGFGTVCKYHCDPGYELKGSKSSNCTGRHGTWTGKNSARRCVDVEPPKIECPGNFSVKTDEDLHFATVKLKMPKTTDNSGENPVIWSKPPFEDDVPVRLIIGENEIQVYSVDGAGNYGFCSFTVEVRDEEKPKILQCRSPEAFFLSQLSPHSSQIEWEEPVFDDNSGVPITVTRTPSHNNFPLGTTVVTYTATDAAGNSAFCSLNVTLLHDPCSERPKDTNTLWNCTADAAGSTVCIVSCPEGSTLATSTGEDFIILQCTYSGRKAYWTPDIFDGDVDLFPECSGLLEPDEIQSEIVIEAAKDLCGDGNALSNDLITELSGNSMDFSVFCEDDDDTLENSGNEGKTLPAKQIDKEEEEEEETDDDDIADDDDDDDDKDQEKMNENNLLVEGDEIENSRMEVSASSTASINNGETEIFETEKTRAELRRDEPTIFVDSENFLAGTNFPDSIGNNENGDKFTKETMELNARSYGFDQTTDASVPINRKKRSANARRKKIKIRFSQKGTRRKNKGSNEGRVKVEAGTENQTETFDWLQKIYRKHNNRELVEGDSVIKRTVVCKKGSVPKRNFCVKCPRGTFHDDVRSKCRPCPIGQYQEVEGQTECLACPENHSTKKVRRKHLKQCKRICPPGTFGKAEPGSVLALAPCTVCPVAYYQDSKGQTFCEPCPANLTTLRSGGESLDACIAPSEMNDFCATVNCRNGGTCYSHEGFGLCKCLPGFSGSFCERTFDPCASMPCYNGGRCEAAGPLNYTCFCPSGYEGRDCEKETDDCFPDPCLGRGECTDLHNAFKCDCYEGYKGSTCNESVSNCLELQPCANGGSCVDTANDSYVCECAEGFFGRHCEVTYDCETKDCSNSGTEEDSLKPLADPCVDFPCEKNKRCMVQRNRKPKCVCLDGFRGPNCTQEIGDNVIVKFPKYGVTEYLLADFPERDFEEISICVWIETKDTFNYGTIFSYATRDTDNAFTLTDYSGLVLYVNGDHVVTDLKANDGFWHFICVSWESHRGRWQVYLDGSLFSEGVALSKGAILPGRGILIVGQEQDFLGGGFNDVESFAGRMTSFDVWDRVLESSEVAVLYENCTSVFGNLIPWPRLLQRTYGDLEEEKLSFCQSCDPLLKVRHGNITFSSINDRKVATYVCDEGFVVKFDSDKLFERKKLVEYDRKCMKSGNWHVKEPKCTRISCGFPGYFLGGEIFGRSYRFGDEIVYRCSEGYTMEGNGTRKCQWNGTWSGRPPHCREKSTECGKLNAPRHGSMFVYYNKETPYSSTVMAAGDKVEFDCDRGYAVAGFRILTCMPGGTWDREPPTCQKIRCTWPKELSRLLPPSAVIPQQTYHLDDVLTLVCPFGQRRSIVCGPLGSWNLTANICRNVCKGSPNIFSHGIVLEEPPGESAYEGDALRVGCLPGYQRHGDDTVTCSKNGTWIQIHPTSCHRKSCGRPPRPPPMYQIVHEEGYFVGDRILLRCSPGFSSPGEVSIRCQPDGRYSRVRNFCTRTFCDPPPLPPPNNYNLEVTNENQTSYPLGSKIEVKCPPGKISRSSSDNYIVCREDGLWSFPPECI